MTKSIRSLLSCALVLASPFAVRVAGGQVVGYPPSGSPYLDLEHAQEFTIVVGHLSGHRDPATIAPQGGLLVGGHYEWRASGPLHLVTEFARISSESHVINPFKVGTARDLGNLSRPLYTADFDLGMSLTGGKSWHHFVPEVAGGAGFISDFRSQPDSGGYKFGSRFVINWGGGLRFVPGGRWQIRGDFKDRLYTIGYPESFYVAPAGGTAVIPTTQRKSFWTHNPAFTIGLSRLF